MCARKGRVLMCFCVSNERETSKLHLAKNWVGRTVFELAGAGSLATDDWLPIKQRNQVRGDVFVRTTITRVSNLEKQAVNHFHQHRRGLPVSAYRSQSTTGPPSTT